MTRELQSRPARTPDYASEIRVLVDLAETMASSPQNLLKKAADAALELCLADSAGISIAESDCGQEIFRWRATSGVFSKFLLGTMPRDFSPCGTVLQQNCSLLMADPQRYYPYIANLGYPINEVLLVPFYHGEKAVGTIWVVSHSASRLFDAEDLRILENLTRFASAATQTLANLEAAERAKLLLEQEATARRQIENELRDAQQRLMATLTAGEVATWTWNIVENRVVADRNLARLFSVSQADASGGPIEKYLEKVHEGDRLRVQNLIESALQSGELLECEYRVNQPEGGSRKVIARSRAELDDNGRAICMPGVVVDVTDRARAEDNLREVVELSDHQRRVYETALSSTNDFNYVLDLQGRFTFANAAFLSLWQKSPADVLGKSFAALSESPELAERYERLLQTLLTTGGIAREETVYQFGQTELHFENLLAPVTDASGHVVAVAGFSRDITDRKRYEAELRTKTERMRLLWESASVLLTTDEPDAMMRGLFGKIANHFGLDTYFNFLVDESGAELCLSSCAGVPQHLLPSVQRLKFGEAICGAVAQSCQPITATRVQVSTDPRVQLIKQLGIRAYACNPLLAGDRLLGTLSFGSRTREEFDLDELEFLRTICQYVTVAYERLRLVTELRDSDRKKDDFIALLAHELRNPLAPLRNGLQVMKLADPNSDAVQTSRSMMERQLSHMVRLIDDLLDVSRISRNKMELRHEHITLAEVIDAALETCRPLIEANQHELTVSLPREQVILDADLTRLAQVFGNLLTNSVKYTRPGGKIWVVARVTGQTVDVSVRDSGIGIPRESLSHIFDMFSQVDRSLERSTGGLGIGLALVSGLVGMHGGRVTAESDGEDQGSTFTVSLPIIGHESGDSISRESSAMQPTLSKTRVLIADDNRDGAESLAMVVGLMGSDVRTAGDGLEALQLAATFQPDVILMDIGMPRLNGLDATRQIRAQQWGQSVTIVALTGWGQDGDRERSREAGCDGHLVKPVDLQELQSLLNRLGHGK